jgi:hypothetical protein
VEGRQTSSPDCCWRARDRSVGPKFQLCFRRLRKTARSMELVRAFPPTDLCNVMFTAEYLMPSVVCSS